MSEPLKQRLRQYKVGPHDGPPLHPTICDEAADELARMINALKPFAQTIYASVGAEWDDIDICAGIKVSDLKRARDIYESYSYENKREAPLRCADCGQSLPLLYPCLQQGCPSR